MTSSEKEQHWNELFGKTVKYFVDKDYFDTTTLAKFLGMQSRKNLEKVMDGSRKMTFVTFMKMCESFRITPEVFFKRMKFIEKSELLGGK